MHFSLKSNNFIYVKKVGGLFSRLRRLVGIKKFKKIKEINKNTKDLETGISSESLQILSKSSSSLLSARKFFNFLINPHPGQAECFTKPSRSLLGELQAHQGPKTLENHGKSPQKQLLPLGISGNRSKVLHNSDLQWFGLVLGGFQYLLTFFIKSLFVFHQNST